MNTRIGSYAWGGPGTVRMINLKFFDPRIDTASLMRAYDYDYLAAMQEKFGITDVWATYSWGFALEREREDHQFLITRVKNFKKLGLKVHAYIQGTNLVYDDYADTSWFCRDERERLVPYHRGRKITCVNNPGFRAYIAEKIRSMRGHGFDGIFMDNVQMGQLAFGGIRHRAKMPIAFAGCNCLHCRIAFHEATDLPIPHKLAKNDAAAAYLEFRVRSTTEFLRMAADEAHEGGMAFGSNSFDPGFDTELVFGTDLLEIAKLQDYLLFENHSLPKNGVSRNIASDIVARNVDKPVFVVSYKRGIGHDSAPSQRDLDLLYSESAQAAFSPCLKGSEYVDRGTWHNLDPAAYEVPRSDIPMRFAPLKKKHLDQHFGSAARLFPPLKFAVRKNYNKLLTHYMENKKVRALCDPAYRAVVR